MCSDTIHDAVLCAEERGRTPARSIDAAIVKEPAYGCDCRLANGIYRHITQMNQESRKPGRERNNSLRCAFLIFSWIRGFQIVPSAFFLVVPSVDRLTSDLP